MTISVKNKIRKSFSKSFKTYDKNNKLQTNTANKLINMVEQHQSFSNVIVDFACGTGISTQLLLNHCHHLKLYGIDFSKKLLLAAKQNVQHGAMFICADFDEIIFKEDYINLAFCNMGLQWSLDLMLTFTKIKRQLSQSGLFAFCLPIEGTFIEFNKEYRNNFYSREMILSYLSFLRFELVAIEETKNVNKFDSVLSALKSIRHVGANINLNDKKSHKGILSQLKVNNIFIDSKEITLTYQIGFFICKKGY